MPTVGNSEKSDLVAAKILEGRVAIITDGTPFFLTGPYLFVEAFHSSEDYYSRLYYATIVRWIRLITFFLSVFYPTVNVAVTTFHQEMIPPALLITMAAASEGTTFPAVVEALGMGIIFEVLKEAGVRLPRPIGQAVSIVFVLALVAKDMELKALSPILEKRVLPVLHGAFTIAARTAEILLVAMLILYLNRPKMAKKAIILGKDRCRSLRDMGHRCLYKSGNLLLSCCLGNCPAS